MTPLRPELERLPARMSTLPIDERGYPVPWFVAWQNGKPEFRAMDTQKWIRAVQQRRCWVCGGPLGRHVAFVAGPMCGLNRTSAEPPSHLECAEWSARNCPFLSRPHMVRREDAVINTESLKDRGAGIPIERNPGVAMVWVTTSYRVFDDGKGRPLIEMGPADRVLWYAEGRLATRAEVAASVDSGLPRLRDVARQEGAEAALNQAVIAFTRVWPASVGLA